MIEAAEKNGKFLMIGQCLRFATPYLTLKKYVDEKILGECVAAHFFRGGGTPGVVLSELAARPLPRGGALFDQHIHDVDAVNFIFAVRPRFHRGQDAVRKSAYDTCSTNYYYDNSDRPINTQKREWTACAGPYSYQDFRANF